MVAPVMPVKMIPAVVGFQVPMMVPMAVRVLPVEVAARQTAAAVWIGAAVCYCQRDNRKCSDNRDRRPLPSFSPWERQSRNWHCTWGRQACSQSSPGPDVVAVPVKELEASAAAGLPIVNVWAVVAVRLPIGDVQAVVAVRLPIGDVQAVVAVRLPIVDLLASVAVELPDERVRAAALSLSPVMTSSSPGRVVCRYPAASAPGAFPSSCISVSSRRRDTLQPLHSVPRARVPPRTIRGRRYT